MDGETIEIAINMFKLLKMSFGVDKMVVTEIFD